MAQVRDDLPEKSGRPFLAFTRRYGWVVVIPAPSEPEHTLGFTRPGRVRVERRLVLATAALPPVPDGAL